MQRVKSKLDAAEHIANSIECARNLIRARHENEHIALGLLAHCAFAFIGGQFPHRNLARLGQILDCDRKHFARRFEHLDRLQVLAQQRRLQRRGHHDNLQIGPRRPLDLPCPSQRHIALKMSLMKFIKDQRTNARQRRILLHLPQQDALGHVNDPRLLRRDVLQPVLKAHLTTQLRFALLRHTFRQQPCGQPARLQHDDPPRANEPVIQHELRHLSRFTRPRRRLDHHTTLALQNARQIRAQRNNGKFGTIQANNLAAKEGKAHKEKAKRGSDGITQ